VVLFAKGGSLSFRFAVAPRAVLPSGNAASEMHHARPCSCRSTPRFRRTVGVVLGLARAAATHEAALVVIGGRWPERGLLPRRSIAPRIPAGVQLPIVVAS
jgi:hypothetical protein